MKPLYSREQFEQAARESKLPVECDCCGETFYRTKHRIQIFLSPSKKGRNVNGNMYCSRRCMGTTLSKRHSVSCKNCDVTFTKSNSFVKRTLSGNHFCSKSCAATYNNKHKTHGTRRSKLERWIEEQLYSLYPQLDIKYNCKDAIGSELDIYIPSFKLAFELNGIFHYEPIYGSDKLKKIQANDQNKFQACQEKKISLCLIDTSSHSYVTPKTSQKYLDIITNIIDSYR